MTLVLSLVLPGLTDPGLYPWVLGLVPALLGGGAGLVVVLSVYVGYPVPDRASPFSAGNNPGIVRGLLQLSIALLLGVVALPEIAIAAFAAGVPALQWLALPVGTGVGVLCWWGWGRLAQRRLAARGPELLADVRKAV